MKIKEIREMSGLSQAEFAEEYGIPLPTLKGWEYGTGSCPTYVRDLLEKAVNRDYKLLKISKKDIRLGLKNGSIRIRKNQNENAACTIGIICFSVPYPAEDTKSSFPEDLISSIQEKLSDMNRNLDMDEVDYVRAILNAAIGKKTAKESQEKDLDALITDLKILIAKLAGDELRLMEEPAEKESYLDAMPMELAQKFNLILEKYDWADHRSEYISEDNIDLENEDNIPECCDPPATMQTLLDEIASWRDVLAEEYKRILLNQREERDGKGWTDRITCTIMELSRFVREWGE